MDHDTVWDRVAAPSAGGPWEERLLWEAEALGQSLSPRDRRAQQQINALLRGIRALEGAKALTRTCPPSPPEDLRRCYRRSLTLAREFAARAVKGDTGLLWQTAADLQLKQCIRIAHALGSTPG